MTTRIRIMSLITAALVMAAMLLTTVASAGEVTPPPGLSLGETGFVPNEGQEPSEVLFAARGSGFGLFATQTGLRMALLELPDADSHLSDLPLEIMEGSEAMPLSGVALGMEFISPQPGLVISGVDETSTALNYLTSEAQATNLPTYARVRYEGIWPGIDATFEARNGELKYTFETDPGADIGQLRFRWDGATGLSIGPAGELLINTQNGVLVDSAPQAIHGGGVAVDVAFVVHDNVVGFEVEHTDLSQGLVIDPGLVFSTLIGGGHNERDWAGVEFDSVGSLYVGGHTRSVDYPTTPGAFDTTTADRDAVVTKLNTDGSGIVYSTVLGGSANEWGQSLAVDDAGAVILSGMTPSTDFPTTSGAYDTFYNGGADCFVAKLSPDGSSLVYSTFLGGSGSGFERADGVEIDSTGAIYVGGVTSSSDFPTTPGAFDASLTDTHDAFVAKLQPGGAGIDDLVYSTLIGASSGPTRTEEVWEVAVASGGEAVFFGLTPSWDFPTTPDAFDRTYNGGTWDLFMGRLSADGTNMVYLTLLGGGAYDHLNVGNQLVLNPDESITVGSRSNSADFPVTPGAFDALYAGGDGDAFISQLTADGSDLMFSTFLGGNARDVIRAVTTDANGNVYATGLTRSSDFPLASDAYDSSLGGSSDAFVAKINAAGTELLYSTYLGGSNFDEGNGIRATSAGTAVVTGSTWSPDFPTTEGAYDRTFNGAVDIYIAELEIPNRTPIADSGGPYLAHVNETISLDASSSRDPEGGPLDYEWTVESGTLDDSQSARPTYTAPAGAGIYEVALSVTDESGLTSTVTTFVVVFDPASGHVTGGGWIESPAGAYVPDPTAAGRASFGFVAKYHKGAQVPEGNTQFVFHAGDLRFHSSQYDWLVVAGSKAMFKGTGLVNGEAGFGFMLSAIDADNNPNDVFEVDRFRIKIWDSASETVLYDNNIGGEDTADPLTEIESGQIKIHK